MSALAELREKSLDWFEQYGEPIRPFVNRQLLEKGIGFVRRTGLRVQELSRGRARLRMPIRGNRNHIGTMYAGALFTLAEVPGGALFLSSFDTRRYYPIVTEMNIRFVAPARGPVTVDVRLDEDEISRLQAEADANGKAKYTLEAELKNTRGEVVAVSRANYQLRRR